MEGSCLSHPGTALFLPTGNSIKYWTNSKYHGGLHRFVSQMKADVTFVITGTVPTNAKVFLRSL